MPGVPHPQSAVADSDLTSILARSTSFRESQEAGVRQHLRHTSRKNSEAQKATQSHRASRGRAGTGTRSGRPFTALTWVWSLALPARARTAGLTPSALRPDPECGLFPFCPAELTPPSVATDSKSSNGSFMHHKCQTSHSPRVPQALGSLWLLWAAE